MLHTDAGVPHSLSHWISSVQKYPRYLSVNEWQADKAELSLSYATRHNNSFGPGV